VRALGEGKQKKTTPHDVVRLFKIAHLWQLVRILDESRACRNGGVGGDVFVRLCAHGASLCRCGANSSQSENCSGKLIATQN
jgi:hypothetical protein